MISDHLSNFSKYSDTSPSLQKAFNFLLENDLTKMPLGSHPIEGDQIFAIVMEYTTKDAADCIKEAHYKYIDLHYIISGGENVGIAKLTDQKPIEVNKEKDYAFYDCDTAVITLNEGDFVILHPEDIHQTGIQTTTPKLLKKVVVKISVQ